MILCVLGIQAQPQRMSSDKTFVFSGNPVIRNKFTADPAPMVSNGRLYLYVGHDEWYDGQDQASGGKEFNITEWLCYSTDDMKNWTDHGSVLRPTDFKWSSGEAWASQVIERNGKYYYYTSCQSKEPVVGKAIGVAVSDSPTGPFIDPIGKPLVHDKMTDNGQRGWWNDFDPTVLIDDDGQAYLCWGNGTCFFAKLKDNMVELDGEIWKALGCISITVSIILPTLLLATTARKPSITPLPSQSWGLGNIRDRLQEVLKTVSPSIRASSSSRVIGISSTTMPCLPSTVTPVPSVAAASAWIRWNTNLTEKSNL